LDLYKHTNKVGLFVAMLLLILEFVEHLQVVLNLL